MKGAYQKRRERMQELMTQEFSKIGFPSMMLGRTAWRWCAVKLGEPPLHRAPL